RLRLTRLRLVRVAVGRRTRRCGRLAAGGLGLPNRVGLVVGHGHPAATLHPALHRAALRPQLIASRRASNLLVLARARIVITGIAIAGDRLVVITGPIGGDRLVISLGLIAGHGLVIAALNIARGADRRAGIAARVRVITGRGGSRRMAAMVTANLEHVVPGCLTGAGGGSPHRQHAAPKHALPGFHGTVSFLWSGVECLVLLQPLAEAPRKIRNRKLEIRKLKAKFRISDFLNPSRRSSRTQAELQSLPP